MSSSQIRRRPRHVAIFGAVIALGLLVGCTGQRDPGDYSKSVRKNFIAGCDASAYVDTDNAAEMKAKALPTKQCECIYDYFEENVDFGDFSGANSDRRDNPRALDDPEFTKAFEGCGPDGALAKGEKTPTTEAKGETTPTAEVDGDTTTPEGETTTSAPAG